jgi:hypothetical protein
VGSGGQEANTKGWNGLGNNTKQDRLPTEPAKQQQTTATASEPSEPLPQVPPLHGDALVAIEKLKREKNNEGREKDFKRNWKFDICVGKVQDNCD